METLVSLYSKKEKEIQNFLQSFYAKSDDNNIEDYLKWEKRYSNPIEIVDIIGVFIENNDRFDINMWISLDADVLINVTDNNADKIIRYLFERYPY